MARRLGLKHHSVYIMDIYEDRYGRKWVRRRVDGDGDKFYRVDVREEEGKRVMTPIGYSVKEIQKPLTDADVIIKEK